MRARYWIGALVVICLAIGVFWTIRTAPPSPSPWWWRKNPDYHVEVWERGKADATVAMTMPKKVVDATLAFGMKSSISAGNHKVYIGEVRSKVERLPRGEWLTLHEEDATIYIWLDVKGGTTKPPRPVWTEGSE